MSPSDRTPQTVESYAEEKKPASNRKLLKALFQINKTLGFTLLKHNEKFLTNSTQPWRKTISKFPVALATITN